MVSVSQVGPGVHMIDLQTGKKVVSCSAYLVVDEKVALIETGPASVVPDLLDGMRQLGVEPDRLAYIIPTHIHLDHGGGVGTLAREATRAKVVVHERGARHLIDPSRLIESVRQVQGEAMYNEAGPVVPVPQERVWAVSGGETISLGQRELLIVDAPGHAPHQIAIYDRLGRGLFTGDAVGMYSETHRRPMPMVVAPSFDLEQYLDTLRRLRELKPSVLHMPHLGASEDVDYIFDATEKDVRAYGRIVLEGMKAGDSFKDISQRLTEYSQSVGGRKAGNGAEFRLMVTGFAVYFRKQYSDLEMPR